MSFAYENVEDIDREHWISSKPNCWKLETFDDIVVDDQYEMEQNNYVDFQKIDDNSLNTENPIDNNFDFENYFLYQFDLPQSCFYQNLD